MYYKNMLPWQRFPVIKSIKTTNSQRNTVLHTITRTMLDLCVLPNVHKMADFVRQIIRIRPRLKLASWFSQPSVRWNYIETNLIYWLSRPNRCFGRRRDLDRGTEIQAKILFPCSFRLQDTTIMRGGSESGLFLIKIKQASTVQKWSTNTKINSISIYGEGTIF